MSIYNVYVYNIYKPINFHSGLFSELRYMSNGLTFELVYAIIFPEIFWIDAK